MSTYKKVLKQLNKSEQLVKKTELSINKVELALIDDIRKQANEIEKIRVSAVKDADKVESDFKKVKAANSKRIEKARAIQKEIIRSLLKADKAAKDLGLSLPKAFDELEQESRNNIGKIPTSNNSKVFSSF